MSRRRVVINGTYTWLEEEPAVARFHSRDAYGTRGAVTIAEFHPLITGQVNFAESQATAEKRRERNRIANETWRKNHRAPGRAHQGTRYETEEERIAARRASWRASKERGRFEPAPLHRDV